MAKLEERPITPEERNYWAFRPVKTVSAAESSPKPRGTPTPSTRSRWRR